MVRKGPEWRRKLGRKLGHPPTEGLPSAESVSPDEWTLRPRIPIPTASAVLWRPIGVVPAPHAEDHPIFIARSALTAIHDHVHAAADDGLVGFLIGNIVECPETAVHYVVVHTTFPVPARLEHDHTQRLVTQTWPAVRQVARKGGADVLGWYHSHALEGILLTPQDVATHVTYFPAPWHTALVIAGHADRSVAGFFRFAANDDWPRACLPFYELYGPEQPSATGKRLSLVPWSNYQAQAPAAKPQAPDVEPRAPAVEPRTPAVEPRPTKAVAPRESVPVPQRTTPGPAAFFPPDAFDAETPPVSKPHHVGWMVGAGVALVGLCALAYGLWLRLEAPAAPSERPPSPVMSAPRSARFAGLTDSLDQALRAYGVRSQLYQNQQMTCADLADGLVAVDEQWLRYSVQRRTETQPIDSLEDEDLAARVAGVERQFEASGCPRP